MSWRLAFSPILLRGIVGSTSTWIVEKVAMPPLHMIPVSRLPGEALLIAS
jgi:hypothetical protein